MGNPQSWRYQKADLQERIHQGELRIDICFKSLNLFIVY